MSCPNCASLESLNAQLQAQNEQLHRQIDLLDAEFSAAETASTGHLAVNRAIREGRQRREQIAQLQAEIECRNAADLKRAEEVERIATAVLDELRGKPHGGLTTEEQMFLRIAELEQQNAQLQRILEEASTENHQLRIACEARADERDAERERADGNFESCERVKAKFSESTQQVTRLREGLIRLMPFMTEGDCETEFEQAVKQAKEALRE